MNHLRDLEDHNKAKDLEEKNKKWELSKLMTNQMLKSLEDKR